MARLQLLENVSRERYIDPSALAPIYAGLGQIDQVLDALERAYTERSPYMVFVADFPSFFSVLELSSEPRFQDLVRKMKLSPTPDAVRMGGSQE